MVQKRNNYSYLLRTNEEIKEVFNDERSSGLLHCPVCGSRRTHPCGGCWCPPSSTGYGTRHINKYHHTCFSER